MKLKNLFIDQHSYNKVNILCRRSNGQLNVERLLRRSRHAEILLLVPRILLTASSEVLSTKNCEPDRQDFDASSQTSTLPLPRDAERTIKEGTRGALRRPLPFSPEQDVT